MLAGLLPEQRVDPPPSFDPHVGTGAAQEGEQGEYVVRGHHARRVGAGARARRANSVRGAEKAAEGGAAPFPFPSPSPG
ncbi:putative lincosaminide nucleotidyltransferase [Streptomyces sp. Tu6071]|nr:putative lincosaminide nucleotidyltransferase [Streptomyces sp. Tu6071]